MMDMMGMFGGMFVFMMFLPLIVIGALLPVLVYLVARWRNQNENADAPDTQIGLKTAVHLFRVIAFQLGLLAIFMFLLAIISEFPTGDGIRFAFGIGIPAGGVWFVHRTLALRTNGNVFPAVQRMFDGWNLIITGIPGFFALIAFFVVVIADVGGSKGDLLRVIAPYLLTYTGAWAALGFVWFRDSGLLPQGPPPGAGTVPHGGYDPNQMQQPQQGYPPQGGYTPQGGGYPPQGGGGYPPQGGGGYPPPGGGGYPPPGGGGQQGY